MKKKIVLITLIYTLVNIYNYYFTIFPQIYLPIALEFDNKHIFSTISISFLLVLIFSNVIDRYKFITNSKMLLFFTIVICSQSVYNYSKVKDKIQIGSSIILYNLSHFKVSSITTAYIRKKIKYEYNVLKTAFKAAGVSSFENLNIFLFPSRAELNRYCNMPNFYYAYYNRQKETIYLSIEYFNQVIKHELMHFFQNQSKMHRNSFMNESFAYYHQKNYPEIYFARPLDYFQVLKLKNKETRKFKALKTYPSKINEETANQLGAYYLESSDKKLEDLITSYIRDEIQLSLFKDFSSIRDSITEHYLSNQFDGQYNLKFKTDKKELFLKNDYTSILLTSYINTKIDIEEHIYNGSTYKFLKKSIFEIIESNLLNTNDLVSKIHLLEKIYKTLLSKKFYGLATKTYFYINEYNFLLGRKSSVKMHKDVKRNFNRSYLAYFEYLKN